MITSRSDAVECVELMGGAVSERDGHTVITGLNPTGLDVYDWYLKELIEGHVGSIELDEYELADDEVEARFIHIIEDLGLSCAWTRDEDGAPFIIMDEWESIGKINFEYNRRYNLLMFQKWVPVYEKATLKLIEEGRHLGHHNPSPPCGGTYSGMRLGTDEFGGEYVHPSHPKAKSPYQIPDGLDGIGDTVGEYGFSDEYDLCAECGKLIRTSADSYCWQPDFADFDDLGRICNDCIQENYEEEYIELYVNQHRRLLNTYVVDPSLHGWEQVDIKFENGMHHGQNADPKLIMGLLNKQGIDCIFTGSVGQFDVEFTAWVHEEDHMTSMDMLLDGNTDLPYDQATEMAKALKGEHSDHYENVARKVSPQEFIDGTWVGKEDDGDSVDGSIDVHTIKPREVNDEEEA